MSCFRRVAAFVCLIFPLFFPAQSAAVEGVTWTNIINATATGNSLKKTAGCDGCPDSGGTSAQQLVSGDGYIEITIGDTSLLYSVGLSNGNTDTSPSDIDFALRIQNRVEVRENGTYLTDIAAASGDVFRVAAEAGQVHYYKNGVKFYTSPTAPAYPLIVDASLNGLDAEVYNANVSFSGGTPTIQDVIWTELTNVTANGNTITKTSGCEGCEDAGAISQQTINSGDGYFEFTANQVGPLYVAGLSSGNAGTTAADIDFGILIQNKAEVRETGTYKAEISVAVGDVFYIAVENGFVNYYKNGSKFYTSASSPIYPLNVDGSLSNIDSSVYNAKIGIGVGPCSSDSDGDGISNCNDDFPNDPSEWSDLDGDGIGDNSDSDIDGDVMPNSWETAKEPLNNRPTQRAKAKNADFLP